MNIIIMLNGQDATSSCLLSATRIAYDSTKRITTASLTIMGEALSAAASRYDISQYDVDVYSVGLAALYQVIILDGRDGTTKLFEGNIYAITLVQSDTPQGMVFYQCDLNDWGAFLDRAVCWDISFVVTMPNSDQGIINALLGHFCPKITLGDVALIVPVIHKYDFSTKSCRQVLDDMAGLAQATWNVDFDGHLHYKLASAAPPAPFGLSTAPDHSTTFPVRVENYRQDFTNPVNSAYVRGGSDPTTGAFVSASYKDPVSVQQYGEYATGYVDTQIQTAWDAALKAKSIVLQYGYPIETGSFKIWGPDGLQVGMSVHIHEDWLGLDGDYTIVALTMYWEDQYQVRYEATFGAAKPDLETVLRLISQRTLWATSNPPVAVSSGPPPPGSVTDSSIAPPGLSAISIQNVSAGSIQGFITAGQISSVSAGVITGKIDAGQINTVNAGSIVGSIDSTMISSVSAGVISGFIKAGNINAVNATAINGVIVSSQLADQIIDTLGKYAAALRPIPMLTAATLPTMPNPNFPPGSFFYYVPDGKFYQITPNGLSWTVQGTADPTGSMQFYYVGTIRASSITGLIVAAQIGSITSGQITGGITSTQITSVDASTIVGKVAAGHIATIDATQITGAITATQITSITAGQITGTIAGTQIGTITAAQISGSLSYNQIGSVNAATITIGTITDSQIASVSGSKINVGSVTSDKFNGFSIDVGGLANLPGRIRVMNGSGTVVAQMGNLSEVGLGAYGGWFQVFAAGGSNYSNAPIYTDTGGNLHITSPNLANATLTNANISGGTVTNSSVNISGQIVTGVSTFDATYGSLALQNTSAPDSTSFISRGLVFYYNGGKIGSLVRSPGGGYLELECTTGGTYILISGAHGIRSDGGFQVGANIVINTSGQFVGTVNAPGTTVTCGTVSAQSVYSNGYFYSQGQQGINYANAILLAGNGTTKVTLQIVGGLITGLTLS